VLGGRDRLAIDPLVAGGSRGNVAEAARDGRQRSHISARKAHLPPSRRRAVVEERKDEGFFSM